VLGTSVQTVTRRYARLRAEAGLRVVALLDPAATGQKQWLVRLTAATGTAQHARRGDGPQGTVGPRWTPFMAPGRPALDIGTSGPKCARHVG